MKEQELALELKNVSKTFYVEQDGADTLKGKLFQLFGKTKKKKIQALRNINLSINKGETFGLIGKNGSGKSSLIRLMSGALTPDKGGFIKKNGSSMLMNLGVGMSHELTAKENIFISGSALGLRKKQLEKLYEQILEFAELKEFENTKVKHYSTGMKQRLAFSIAINAGADIMFLDEVFAVGDAQFKQKAIQVFEENWIEGRTVVFVSHSLGHIEKYCDRTLYIKNGEIAFLGDSKEAIKLYYKDNNITLPGQKREVKDPVEERKWLINKAGELEAKAKELRERAETYKILAEK